MFYSSIQIKKYNESLQRLELYVDSLSTIDHMIILRDITFHTRWSYVLNLWPSKSYLIQDTWSFWELNGSWSIRQNILHWLQDTFFGTAFINQKSLHRIWNTYNLWYSSFNRKISGWITIIYSIAFNDIYFIHLVTFFYCGDFITFLKFAEMQWKSVSWMLKLLAYVKYDFFLNKLLH